jgi:hypothetical protein
MRKTIFFTLLVIATLSCTPKSAMMTKAVIIDSTPRAVDSQTRYKVALLSYDVVDYVVAYAEYEAGDTILIHDKYRNYEIR